MAETKIYIPDKLDGQFREASMKRFGYGKGSISLAAAEAITQWLMREDRIQKALSRVVEKAEKDRDVVAVMLFGSYTRREADYRDVDIAILLKEKAKAEGKLSVYLDIGDFVENRLLDISVLNELPLDVQSRVFNEGIVVCMKDREAFYDYSANLIRQAADPIAIST